MMQVWFLFKILEAIIGAVCIGYHAKGFQGKEPLPHILIFCGTFFGFTIMAFTGAIALGVGAAPPSLTEFIVNFFAAVLYIVSSIVSMHFAETDFHLMYLSDFEEPVHDFFSFCRAQSICALAAGSLHLLHAVLAFDVMLSPKNTSESSDESDSDSDSDMTTLERRPIRMYFLSKVIENKLRRFQWFDRLCMRRTPNASVFTFGRKRRSSAKVHASKYSMGTDTSITPTNKPLFSKSNKSLKPKESKEKRPKSTDKNIDKKPPPTALNIEDSPDSEEESVSRITYSDYDAAHRNSNGGFLNIRDETPGEERASIVTINETNPNRASIASSIGPKRFSPGDGAQRPRILRKEPSLDKRSFDEQSIKSQKPENEKHDVPEASSSTAVPRSSDTENTHSSNFDQKPEAPIPTPSEINTPMAPLHPRASAAAIQPRRSTSSLKKSFESLLKTKLTPVHSQQSLFQMPIEPQDQPSTLELPQANILSPRSSLSAFSNTPRSILKSASKISKTNDKPTEPVLKILAPDQPTSALPQKEVHSPSPSISPSTMQSTMKTTPTLEQSAVQPSNMAALPSQENLVPTKSTFQLSTATPLEQHEAKSASETIEASPKPTTEIDDFPTPIPSSLYPVTSSDKPADDNFSKSKMSVGTSIPSLPYSTDTLVTPISVHKIEAGISVQSLPFSEDEDNAPVPSGHKSHYFTPTASEGTIFEDSREEFSEAETTPKASKENIKKPPPAPKS